MRARPPGMQSRAKQERPGMVRWYELAQLRKTGAKVVQSRLVGDQADPRLVQGLDAMGRLGYDLSAGGPSGARQPGDGGLIVDFLADCGDGWDGTYTVAAAAHARALATDPRIPSAPASRRGDVLLLGGDEVYPTPSAEAYESRLLGVYRQLSADMAADGTPEPSHDGADDRVVSDAFRVPSHWPQLYAMPGNHDWYDGLVAFSDVFLFESYFPRAPLAATRSVGPQPAGRWRLPQYRSYFVLKLPGNWWWVSTDVQLLSDIDGEQLEYFRTRFHEDGPGPDAKIVFCNPEPFWTESHWRATDPTVAPKLHKLVHEVIGTARIRLWLAGDLHHYRRAESRGEQPGAPVQWLTAGGGGAFLHPTHGWHDTSPPDDRTEWERTDSDAPWGGRTVKQVYPPENVSRALTMRAFERVFRNPGLIGLFAAAYGLVAWADLANAQPLRAGFGLVDFVESVLSGLVRNPVLALLPLGLAATIPLFTDTSSERYRKVAGTLHSAAHLGTAFAAMTALFFALTPTTGTGAVATVTVSLLTALAGSLLGPLVLAKYLWLSLNVFGRHRNEAFSLLQLDRYRHFVRLVFERDGTLWLHTHGMERSMDEATQRDPAARAHWLAENVRPIEAPIRLG